MQVEIRRVKAEVKFTETQIQKIEELASRMDIDKVAEQFGMGEETFREGLERQKAALRAYKKGRTIGAIREAEKLRARMEAGDLEATMFFLKLHGGWDDEPKHKVANRTDSLPALKIIINQNH